MNGSLARSFVLLLLLPGFQAVSCGRTPSAGLEGELCAADNDCVEGLVCERRVCLPLDRVGDMGGDVPPRGGVFFAVIELSEWAGARGGQLQELGRFISDLSTVLSPYYGMWATSETEARFGVVDREAQPINLSASYTITQLSLQRTGTTYEAEQDRLLVPVFYADQNVELGFDMPLTDARLTVTLSSLTVGSTGAVLLTGALQEDDARDLRVITGSDEFTLWDVLRGDEFNVDTDFDGVDDAWAMSWRGDAGLF